MLPKEEKHLLEVVGNPTTVITWQDLVDLTLRRMDHDRDGRISHADFLTTVGSHYNPMKPPGPKRTTDAGSFWHLLTIKVS